MRESDALIDRIDRERRRDRQKDTEGERERERGRENQTQIERERCIDRENSQRETER